MPPLRGAGTGPQADDPEYAGQYRLERRLGSGGMGVVHLARSASGLRLAVKVVHAEYAVDPEFRARFRQEVAAARRVSGAFTASVVDADPDAGRPWMATLYVPGPTLSDRVKRNGPLAPAEVRRLAAGLAEALRDIHRAGLVHRDLKPSNVLLAEDGPKVIDFGISRPYDSELRTETGKLIGTPPFMAPEQFQRPREVGPAADVFALASLLVHAATGRGPFESESPYIVAYQVVHDEPDLTGVPADLVPLIRACLAKEPAERPTPDAIMAMLPVVSEGADALAAAVRPGEPPSRAGALPARPSSGDDGPGDSLRDSPRRRPRGRWIALAATIVVALAAGGAWALNEIDGLGRQPSHARPAPAGASWKPWETSVPEDPAGKGEVRAGFCTHADGALYCSARGVHAARIDAATGKVAWRRAGEAARPGGGTPRAPVVSGGLVHSLSPDKRELVALDPATGDPRWKRDVSAYGGRVYHAGDAVLLVALDGTVTAVDGGTNRELWRHGLPGGIKPVFAFYGSGPAYALAPSADGRRTTVVAVDAVRGTTSWQWTTDGALTAVGTGPGGRPLSDGERCPYAGGGRRPLRPRDRAGAADSAVDAARGDERGPVRRIGVRAVLGRRSDRAAHGPGGDGLAAGHVGGERVGARRGGGPAVLLRRRRTAAGRGHDEGRAARNDVAPPGQGRAGLPRDDAGTGDGRGEGLRGGTGRDRVRGGRAESGQVALGRRPVRGIRTGP